MTRANPRKSSTNQVRVIGGEWRGRKLTFPSLEGLRPTGDRIRETLFNWLGQNLSGMKVLDLFAGSGCLGIEALSRGAEQATFVETNSQTCRFLRNSLSMLSAKNAVVLNLTAESFLENSDPESVDLIFVDPPFANNLHTSLLVQLKNSGILAAEALVYIESPKTAQIPLPAGWSVIKSKHAGDVHYQLVQT